MTNAVWIELAQDTCDNYLHKLVDGVNNIPNDTALSAEDLLRMFTYCVVYGRYIERTQMMDDKIAEDLLKNVKLNFGEGE